MVKPRTKVSRTKRTRNTRRSLKSRGTLRSLKSRGTTRQRKVRTTPLASVYVKTRRPVSRFRIKSSNFSSVSLNKPRLTLKAGFSRWQVENQSMGIGPLKKGKLEGWHASEPKTSRLNSVDKAVRKFGALSTYRSLNALAVLGKNRQPEVASIAKEDRDYVRKRYFRH